MRFKTLLTLLLAALLSGCTPPVPTAAPSAATAQPPAADKVTRIMAELASKPDMPQGEKISQISAAFLGTPYQADTLIGSPDTPEALVMNFSGVDCYTLIDYVQALSRSHDRASFQANLIRTRYVEEEVSYLTRRHFFSDWFAESPRNADDVTRSLSPRVVRVVKQLNRKADGIVYVPGLRVVSRSITYIPASAITRQVLDRIENGDYVGVYSPAEGLDVSHVGIAVRHDGQLWFRNASSLAASRQVVDAPFSDYMRLKPGIVVLRPLPLKSSRG
ncbi:DUF1460 domain-containing protein [Pantoea sp. C2G6]|uniref:DUF1460 domain-containing protein n=1 Tax=Pantoea sp. C2G6 TaxID=3243084 RepID=UPI003ED9DECC